MRPDLHAIRPIEARIKSWQSQPFVDIIVIDSVEFNQGCPDSHPDEVIFEVWPGSTAVCNCA